MATTVISGVSSFSRSSRALCCCRSIVSAVVTQPLHAKQSCKLTLIAFVASSFTVCWKPLRPAALVGGACTGLKGMQRCMSYCTSCIGVAIRTDHAHALGTLRDPATDQFCPQADLKLMLSTESGMIPPTTANLWAQECNLRGNPETLIKYRRHMQAGRGA